jgi:hypothetical protein
MKFKTILFAAAVTASSLAFAQQSGPPAGNATGR